MLSEGLNDLVLMFIIGISDGGAWLFWLIFGDVLGTIAGCWGWNCTDCGLMFCFPLFLGSCELLIAADYGVPRGLNSFDSVFKVPANGFVCIAASAESALMLLLLAGTLRLSF